MRAVVQRVLEAKIEIDGVICSNISKGMLVFVAFEDSDNLEDFKYIIEKTIGLRIFEDVNGKMNVSISELNGEILIVPNFTLFGDARKGRRPSFSNSSTPENARVQFEVFKKLFSDNYENVDFGVFQADMKVHLINDGPITILLESKRNF